MIGNERIGESSRRALPSRREPRGATLARSDLILSLAEAAVARDDVHLRRTLAAMAAEERAKQHHVLADRLELTLNKSEAPVEPSPPSGLPRNGDISQLLHVITPQRKVDSLVLDDDVRLVFDEVVEEQQRSELLRAHNVEPRHRLLLIGPPGNGKTSLAEAFAEALLVPLLVVRYEGVIGSFLGETAGRLRRVFEYARARSCVLFFDEFDTLGKERGDPHDTGEVKRVVSSLLLQIDDLPAHVVVVSATNHAELLDRAVWRRFQVHLELPPPKRSDVVRWLQLLATRLRFRPTEADRAKAMRVLSGRSYSDLEAFSDDVLRRLILESEGSASQVFRTRLRLWERRLTAPRTDG